MVPQPPSQACLGLRAYWLGTTLLGGSARISDNTRAYTGAFVDDRGSERSGGRVLHSINSESIMAGRRSLIRFSTSQVSVGCRIHLPVLSAIKKTRGFQAFLTRGDTSFVRDFVPERMHKSRVQGPAFRLQKVGVRSMPVLGSPRSVVSETTSHALIRRDSTR